MAGVKSTATFIGVNATAFYAAPEAAPYVPQGAPERGEEKAEAGPLVGRPLALCHLPALRGGFLGLQRRQAKHCPFIVSNQPAIDNS